MSLPSSQVNPCQSKKRKAVEDELEHSFLLLDLWQLIIKRGENAEIEANIQFQSYIRFAKKTQKQFKKVSDKSTSANQESCRIVKLSGETRHIAIILNLIAVQSSREQSLIHKTFQESRVPCKVEQLEVLEIEIVDLEAGVEALFKKLIQNSTLSAWRQMYQLWAPMMASALRISWSLYIRTVQQNCHFFFRIGVSPFPSLNAKVTWWKKKLDHFLLFYCYKAYIWYNDPNKHLFIYCFFFKKKGTPKMLDIGDCY